MLQAIHLINVRSFEQVHIELRPGAHLFFGANAQGKTTILEALQVAFTGASFRCHNLLELVRHGSDCAQIGVSFIQDGIANKLKIQIEGNSKRAWLNGNSLSSMAQLVGLYPVILLAPQDNDLIRGEPQARRLLLDTQLAQADPLYHHYLTRYRRALKQRNALLKERSASTCYIWEHEMALAGAYIVQQRQQAVTALALHLQHFMQEIAPRSATPSLEYRGCDSTNLLQLWADTRSKDLEYGTTTVGPHRDDVRILIGDHLARDFASEGEARTLAAAIRLAQLQLLDHKLGYQALALVDDLGLGLDGSRSQSLQRLLEMRPQAFCTAPDSYKIESWVGPSFRLHQGSIQADLYH